MPVPKSRRRRSTPAGTRTTARARGFVGAISFCLAVAALYRPALASDCAPANRLSTCIDADILWPHAGAGPFFSLGSVITTPADQVSFDVVLSYLSRPIGIRVASPDPEGTPIYVIDNAVDATFLWALGLTNRLELTLASAVTLYQNGSGLSDIVGDGIGLPRSVLRDTRFGLSFALVPRPRTGAPKGFAVTSRLEWSAPSGDKTAFAGDRTMVAFPSITAAFQHKRFAASAEIGARLRGETQLAGARIGSQIDAALGTAYDVLDRHRLTIGLEAFALYTLAHQDAPVRDVGAARGPALAPAEWILSVTTAPLLGGDVSFSLGGGSAIPLATEPAVTAPRFRFDLGLRYAPIGRDTHGNGNGMEKR